MLPSHPVPVAAVIYSLPVAAGAYGVLANATFPSLPVPSHSEAHYYTSPIVLYSVDCQ